MHKIKHFDPDMDHLVIDENSYTTFNFSGGEVHVELTDKTRFALSQTFKKSILLNIRMSSSDKVMQVIMLNDILKRAGFYTSLYMGYIPYARQDRETIQYGANSLKVFANLINSCKFEKVYVVEPHSIVSENVIENIKEIDISETIQKYIDTVTNGAKDFVLLSPDLGAVKRVEEFNKTLATKVDILIANKVRNPATGEITSVKLIGDVPIGKQIIVLDDIIDGGASFIELLKRTQLHKNNDVHLWGTHGIYSKGDQILFDAGFKSLGTTNTFRKNTLELTLNKVYMYDVFTRNSGRI